MPFFWSRNAVVPLAIFDVEDAKGEVKSYALLISGRSGKPTLVPMSSINGQAAIDAKPAEPSGDDEASSS